LEDKRTQKSFWGSWKDSQAPLALQAQDNSIAWLGNWKQTILV